MTEHADARSKHILVAIEMTQRGSTRKLNKIN